MSLHSKHSLYSRLQDPKFREAFVASRIAQTIATQIRVMRQRNDMSQKDLARELGTSQNAVYRLENPRSGRPNVSTLERIAAFFRVGLVVRFAPLSEIVDWTLTMSGQSINVPEFEKDPGFTERKPPETEALIREPEPVPAVVNLPLAEPTPANPEDMHHKVVSISTARTGDHLNA